MQTDQAVMMRVKHSAIAIILSLLIGVAIGAWLMGREDTKIINETLRELREKDEQLAEHKYRGDSLLTIAIRALDSIKARDSIISNLNLKLYDSQRLVEDKQKELNKMTHNEVGDWIRARYKH